ncbi:TolC family protein [Alteriqipengyuania flavescens]|uniref:TolC family protein n=1 Tax=Alteriqipengyuania flavescens TaxID=3053610 RepID=UPI0025B39E30|nr:TolC family protein [Alteriqipengyuania flavescens]WJY17541.1 TolC family protein [Alteriqipengyuania flavescens]WJY23484.1 TolC family protein [Alteriqipengyuania flavescens]
MGSSRAWHIGKAMAFACLAAGFALPAQAQVVRDNGTVTLQGAVAAALETNPQIIQAQYNEEAVSAQEDQARGAFYPQVDLEAGTGVRQLRNNTRTNLGIADDLLYPTDARAGINYTIFDFGRRRGELARQAARADAAAVQVVQRADAVALEVARRYLDLVLQDRLALSAQESLVFHRVLVGDLQRGIDAGTVGRPERRLAEDRLQAALVREIEAGRARDIARIQLLELTGLDIARPLPPPDLSGQLPEGLDMAIATLLERNPAVLAAQLEVTAAEALLQSIRGERYPEIGVDLAAQTGDDIDGFGGQTDDLRARVSVRWNVFDGGITEARVREASARANEQRFRLAETARAASAELRAALSTADAQGRFASTYGEQTVITQDLSESYRRQFEIGRRNLLELLDARMRMQEAQDRQAQAEYARLFAQYEALALLDLLLESLQLAPPIGH